MAKVLEVKGICKEEIFKNNKKCNISGTHKTRRVNVGLDIEKRLVNVSV